MAEPKTFVGKTRLRPYAHGLIQVTIPRELATRMQLRTGEELWVSVLPTGLALTTDGPFDKNDAPRRDGAS